MIGYVFRNINHKQSTILEYTTTKRSQFLLDLIVVIENTKQGLALFKLDQIRL